MEAAIVIGAVATVVALLGVLGRPSEGRAWPSQVITLALPLAIIAGGYAAGVGMTLLWAVVAVLATFLAVLAGSLLGRPIAAGHDGSRPATAGLSLVFSGLIALGLAVIVVEWGANLVGSFAYLNSLVVKLVLVAAAVAYGIGSRAIAGLSRITMIVVIVGALGILVAGAVVGDFGTLGAPLIEMSSVPVANGVLYAIGVVLIGAGFPVLRHASHGNRRASVIAAVVLALVLAVYLLGMLAIYGGSYDLPSLVINVFPVFLPSAVGAVLSGLVALVVIVVAGTCIRAASECAAAIAPQWYEDVEHNPGPRRWVGLVMGLAVLIAAELAPAPSWVVALLALLGLANLIAEWLLTRSARAADSPSAPEPEDAAVS